MVVRPLPNPSVLPLGHFPAEAALRDLLVPANAGFITYCRRGQGSALFRRGSGASLGLNPIILGDLIVAM